MSWPALLVAGLLGAALGYQLLAWWAIRRFLGETAWSRRRSTEGVGGGAFERARPRAWPGVSQIKPFRALEPGLRERLDSFLLQDYPGPMELTLATAEELEGSGPGVKGLVGHRFGRQVALVAEPGRGSNRKIAACLPAVGRARHDLLVFSDSDMRVDSGWLQAVVQPFADPRVGMVTCLYTVREVDGLGAALEGLAVADFASSVLVARQVEGLSFALGATMAIRREVLDRIGGLEAVEDLLADDYQLGHRTVQAGYRVELAPTVVEDVVGRVPLAEFFSHQLRWMRTYRLCRPGGHFAFLLTQGSLWSLALLALEPGAPMTALAVAAWWGVRTAACASSWRGLARAPVAGWALLAPLKDLLWGVLWCLSWAGSRVRWGSTVYRLDGEGRMRAEGSTR